MNMIIIKNLKIFAFHGVHDHEKQNGQNFYIDAVLHANIGNIFEDNINNTISYSDAIKYIKKIMTEKSFDLIETAAENISKKMFEKYPLLEKLELTIKKPEAPINETFEYVGIKIIRSRSDYIKWKKYFYRLEVI